MQECKNVKTKSRHFLPLQRRGVGGVFFLMLLLTSCGKNYVPKPFGYFRIALPEQRYQPFDSPAYPFRFEISESAEVQNRPGNGGMWFDIVYPSLNARINCTYLPVRGNLRALSDDAQEFVYKHASMANSIPEQGFENPDKDMYGVFFSIRGNTASPYQFYMTDSTRHFLRGAVYFNCVPNQDSLAPVFDFMETDLRHLIETLEWK